MAGIVRQGDLCSGHGPFPPRLPTSWSSNVYVNGRPVIRQGDSWATHCTPEPSLCHTGTSTGTGSVYVNGYPLQISGDPISCGSTCDASSSNVFAKEKIMWVGLNWVNLNWKSSSNVFDEDEFTWDGLTWVNLEWKTSASNAPDETITWNGLTWVDFDWEM